MEQVHLVGVVVHLESMPAIICGFVKWIFQGTLDRVGFPERVGLHIGEHPTPGRFGSGFTVPPPAPRPAQAAEAPRSTTPATQAPSALIVSWLPPILQPIRSGSFPIALGSRRGVRTSFLPLPARRPRQTRRGARNSDERKKQLPYPDELPSNSVESEPETPRDELCRSGLRPEGTRLPQERKWFSRRGKVLPLGR